MTTSVATGHTTPDTSRRWRPDDDTWWSPFTLARLDGALRQAERYTATVGAGRG